MASARGMHLRMHVHNSVREIPNMNMYAPRQQGSTNT